MTYLITGAAGFIGSHLAHEVMARGERVLGIDNLDPYYDPDLKAARLTRLQNEPLFEFAEVSISDMEALREAVKGKKIKKIIHLAGQAGVRYSIDNPQAYGEGNLIGHLNMLEIARHMDDLEHMNYASSSSIYGGRTGVPFLETDSADKPVSLYAATKKANELMSYSYSHLYGIPLTGLRFFTVYGPWGRPDMAYFLFTKAIIEGKPIKVFNHGDMLRDFTYIDDLVSGILAISEKGYVGEDNVPHSVYNIGNNQPEKLGYFIELLEKIIGREAQKELLPMQAGDVPVTFANIDAIKRDYGFEPRTDLETGLREFVRWYRQFYAV